MSTFNSLWVKLGTEGRVKSSSGVFSHRSDPKVERMGNVARLIMLIEGIEKLFEN
jgi:hypothetical protein